MKTIGIMTTAFAATLAALGAVALVMSLPDIKRYLKIKAM